MENEVGVTAVFVIVDVSDEYVSNVSWLMKLGDKQPVIKAKTTAGYFEVDFWGIGCELK